VHYTLCISIVGEGVCTPGCQALTRYDYLTCMPVIVSEILLRTKGKAGIKVVVNDIKRVFNQATNVTFANVSSEGFGVFIVNAIMVVMYKLCTV
jgi:hypothetical protein